MAVTGILSPCWNHLSASAAVRAKSCWFRAHPGSARRLWYKSLRHRSGTETAFSLRESLINTSNISPISGIYFSPLCGRPCPRISIRRPRRPTNSLPIRHPSDYPINLDNIFIPEAHSSPCPARSDSDHGSSCTRQVDRSSRRELG